MSICRAEKEEEEEGEGVAVPSTHLSVFLVSLSI